MNFETKIHMTRCINQIKKVALSLILVDKRDCSRLYRDASLFLDLQLVGELLNLLLSREQAGLLEKSIGQGALTVIDVCHNTEVTNLIAGERLQIDVLHFECSRFLFGIDGRTVRSDFEQCQTG